MSDSGSGVETPPTAPPGYTILRIKRRRDEEPLDALVVESTIRKKKSRAGAGLFQFAETVEGKAWESAQRELQERITALASKPDASAHAKAQQQPVPVPTAKGAAAGAPSLPASSPTKDPRRYQIVQRDLPPAKSLATKRPLVAPPKIVSARELAAQKAASRFTMYDAVLSAPQDEPPPDEEMDKFMPMLQDYLRINDIAPTSTSYAQTKEREEDFVYDVFYHRPMAAAHAAALSRNTATLTGLPRLEDEESDDDDSEEEDEDDEDSNAEDYYKNEYPEEEEPSSEDFSDSSDEFHDSPNDDDHDWR